MAGRHLVGTQTKPCHHGNRWTFCKEDDKGRDVITGRRDDKQERLLNSEGNGMERMDGDATKVQVVFESAKIF